MTETDVEKRIKEMEVVEKEKLAQNKKEEVAANKGVLYQNPGGPGATGRFVPPKAEAIIPTNNDLGEGVNKPIFINNKDEERKVPQPPQLIKKPVATFAKPEEKTNLSGLPTEVAGAQVKNEIIKPVTETPKTTDKDMAAKKSDYDELLGN